ncbi:MAG: sucrase ferredoxin, partial [Anaerolineae bacterium]|nr:sucrase ferredoxin [Anaerolineae bacterium]
SQRSATDRQEERPMPVVETDNNPLMPYQLPMPPDALPEIVVPDALAPDLITALFAGGEPLQSFGPYRQQSDQLREIFVCTHGSRDVCCGQTGYPIYEILRTMNPIQANIPIRAWRVSHNGGHKFAPTILDFPYGHHWGHFEIPALLPLVERRGSVDTLLRFYRGWTGLDNKFLQMAERAVWQREGWAWLDYEKSGEILSLDEAGQWAEVRLDYRSPDGARSGAYTARLEASGRVQTLAKSGYGALEWVDQYRVTRLERVDAIVPIAKLSH